MILRLLSLSLCAAGFIAGFLFVIAPEKLIEAQRRFYEKINWKIEPIDFAREIRNTRIMGLSILLFVAAALILFLTSPLSSKLF